MIVTSNKPFSAWGEIFGDDMAATAMIDRLIHHSEILSLKGDSYRLRGKDLDAPHRRKTRRTRLTHPWARRRVSDCELRSALHAFAPLAAAYRILTGWATFQPAQVGHFSTGLDMSSKRARPETHAPSTSAMKECRLIVVSAGRIGNTSTRFLLLT
jgi:IstB-like ATP binding protein